MKRYVDVRDTDTRCHRGKLSRKPAKSMTEIIFPIQRSGSLFYVLRPSEIRSPLSFSSLAPSSQFSDSHGWITFRSCRTKFGSFLPSVSCSIPFHVLCATADLSHGFSGPQSAMAPGLTHLLYRHAAHSVSILPPSASALLGRLSALHLPHRFYVKSVCRRAVVRRDSTV